MSKTKRKSISIRDKLHLVQEFRASGLSGRKFASQKGISESAFRHWLKIEDKMKQVPKSSIRRVRNICRLKIGHWPEIDTELFQWVIERNKKGLRVKDKFIEMQARAIRDRILDTLDDGDYKTRLSKFAGSRIFVHRFKNRYNLGSRRHTTTHTLPERFRELAVDFIDLVHRKISARNIPRERIINMDQVCEFFCAFYFYLLIFLRRSLAITRMTSRRRSRKRDYARFFCGRAPRLTKNSRLLPSCQPPANFISNMRCSPT
jgi:hypothetical protein